MSEKRRSGSITANPPPYPGAKPAKRKGPIKRLLNGIKALFCGKGRNPDSEHEHNKARYQATLDGLQAQLKRDEVEKAANEAWLKSCNASLDFLRADYTSTMALYKLDENRANADANLKRAYETWLESLAAEIKLEEARIVHCQREQDLLEVSKEFLEAAIRSSLLKLQEKL